MAAVSAARLGTDSDERRLAEALEREGVDVLAASDRVFGAISPVRTPSGIVAIAVRDPADAARICRHANGFVVTAVDVQDPGNLGSLVRTAEAGAATGVLVCTANGSGSANPFSWKALRGSMGSALRLPVAPPLPAEDALACLKDAGARVVAAVARGGRDPDAIGWSGHVGLLLGGEGAGLSDALASACDERVTIPMSRSVESLNVAVAGGILIYAARRQRQRPAPGQPVGIET